MVILTTEAHSSVAVIHDRMPVIVGLDGAAAWMAGEIGVEFALGVGAEAAAKSA